MGFKNKPQYQSLSWCCNFLLAIFCAFIFGFNIYFNGSLACPKVFRHYANYTPNEVMHHYMTQITLGSYLYWMWGAVYVIMIMWFIYVFYLLLCRLSCSRDNKTPLFSGFFWFLFIIVNLLNSLWLYLFVHDHILISGIILLTSTAMLYALNILAYRLCLVDIVDSKNCSNEENNELLNCEITLLKLLTLNGLPLFAICCTITACLQWAIILKYFLFHFSDNISCIVALAILTILLIIYWGLDILFARKYFVCTWLPYFALIYAFGAIIFKKNSIGCSQTPGVLFSFILLIVTVILLIIKSCSLCFCYPKSPNPNFSRV